MTDNAKHTAAVSTLEHLGYTYCGGELWKPPLGKAPDFCLIDTLRTRIAELEAELEAVGAGGVQALSAAPAEYVGNGMFKGETIQKAAEHWANWCDVRCMTGLSEFLRFVAASPTPPAEQQECDTPSYCRSVQRCTAQDEARMQAAPKAAPSEGDWISADDVQRLVRQIDAALNGEAGAAPQASLCDVVGQVVQAAKVLGRPVLAAPKAAPGEPGAWDGAEEWMKLAWHLCAEENGEDACTELIWEGGPTPEPWGNRWLKYEGEARRMIDLVRTHVQAPQQEAQEPVAWLHTDRLGGIQAFTTEPPPGLKAKCQPLYPAPQPAPAVPDVDWLSNVIRSADGNNLMGAGALAEVIVAALAAQGGKDD